MHAVAPHVTPAMSWPDEAASGAPPANDATSAIAPRTMPAPIEFAPYRLFVPAAESVLFFARQGNRTLRCYATRAALVTYFDAQPGDEDATSDELLAAYDRASSTLHAIARGMIDAGVASPDGAVVVTTDRVFRSLVGMN